MLFFLNDGATTEIYTLSLHDALPICPCLPGWDARPLRSRLRKLRSRDRKSTRLNSSHITISYAVFCLKKKKFEDQPNAFAENLLPRTVRTNRPRYLASRSLQSKNL